MPIMTELGGGDGQPQISPVPNIIGGLEIYVAYAPLQRISLFGRFRRPVTVDDCGGELGCQLARIAWVSSSVRDTSRPDRLA